MSAIPPPPPPPPISDDPWEHAAHAFLPSPDYNLDPALWGAHRLGEYWHDVQRQILHSLRDNRYTAVPSCHGAGKSFIAARAIAKWIDEHPPGEAFVVSTAPTSAQVSAILWREILKAHKKGRLPGRIIASGYPEWKIEGGEIVGYGRKPADYDQAAFQGIHARYVLVVIDEAGGIDKNLFDAVDALATNEHARVLAIGNPDDPSAHFANVCKPDSGWNVIRIDGLRTPNFTEEAVTSLKCPQCAKVGQSKTLLVRLFEEEEIPFNEEEVPDDLRPMLLSPLWVEERLHRWVGRSSASQSISELASQSSLFTAKVRGLFPTTGSEGVIPLGWAQAAVQRWHDWDDRGRPALPGRLILGADIARSGDDETAIASRRGPAILNIRKHRQADTMETTNWITALLNEPESLAIVDAIGIGAGVVDRLREMDKSVIPFTASNTAKGLTDRSGEFQFTNLRAAAWWNLRELLDPSRGSEILLPDSEILIADLTTPKWKILAGGKIQIEAKDDIKKRIGRSTDEGDAVVQAFWVNSDTGAANDDTVSWWDGLTDDEVLNWGVEGMAATWQ